MSQAVRSGMAVAMSIVEVIMLGGYLALFIWTVWPVRKPPSPHVHCHAHERIIKDLLAKNMLIHRLETRIHRLKRANRNLREELKRRGVTR